MKKIEKKLIVFLCVIILICSVYLYDRMGVFTEDIWSSAEEYLIEEEVIELQTSSEGKYKIMQITDLHFSALFLKGNSLTYKFLDAALKNEKPDLVMLTGDMAISLLNRTYLRIFADFMEERQQYWSYTLGNHDYQIGSGVYRLLKILNNYDYCLMKIGPTNIGGYANYFMTINNGDEILHSIAVIDTSRYFVTEKQVEFYNWNIENIKNKNGDKVNNLIFMHIPLEIVSKANPVLINESVDHLKSDGGLYNAIIQGDVTKYVFNGHDHTNNHSTFDNGVTFISVPSTGFSGYGKYNVPRGFAIIEINNEQVNYRISSHDEYGIEVVL